MEFDFGDICKRNLEKGTDIGFNKEEIKKTSTEDLLTLRKSIVIYLKSKKLKKRNGNFMEVYQRINEELKTRKMKEEDKEEGGEKEGFVKVDVAPKRKTSTGDLGIPLEETVEKTFLRRKTSMNFEIEIPSFFNDKKQKTESKSIVEQKKEDKEIPCTCLTDFGKGLFDEKLDFDPSDDMEPFRVAKKQNFDAELKEIEIKTAMFNAIPEDMFFSLD